MLTQEQINYYKERGIQVKSNGELIYIDTGKPAIDPHILENKQGCYERILDIDAIIRKMTDEEIIELGRILLNFIAKPDNPESNWTKLGNYIHGKIYIGVKCIIPSYDETLYEEDIISAFEDCLVEGPWEVIDPSRDKESD